MKSNEGGATEDNNLNFARGFLNDIFFNSQSVSPTEANNQNFAWGSPTWIYFSAQFLQNQIQVLLVLQKNKALPEGGQQPNSKYETDQDQVLIIRGTGYRT